MDPFKIAHFVHFDEKVKWESDFQLQHGMSRFFARFTSILANRNILHLSARLAFSSFVRRTAIQKLTRSRGCDGVQSLYNISAVQCSPRITLLKNLFFWESNIANHADADHLAQQILLDQLSVLDINTNFGSFQYPKYSYPDFTVYDTSRAIRAHIVDKRLFRAFFPE